MPQCLGPGQQMFSRAGRAVSVPVQLSQWRSCRSDAGRTGRPGCPGSRASARVVACVTEHLSLPWPLSTAEAVPASGLDRDRRGPQCADLAGDDDCINLHTYARIRAHTGNTCGGHVL